MGSCPLNSTELLSGCCSHWSTARNPDCSSVCPTAALWTERVPAPHRPPSPHPAACTQERDSLHLQGSVTFTHFQLPLLPIRTCHYHNPTGLCPAICLGLGTDASLEYIALYKSIPKGAFPPAPMIPTNPISTTSQTNTT